MDRLGVIRRGKTVLLFELSREVVNAGEAKHVADLGDRTVVFLNQKLCVIQLEVGDVLFRTDVQVGPEEVLQGRARNRELNAQILDRDRKSVV